MCILNLIYETWSKYVQVFFVQRFSRMPDFKFCFLSACVGSTTPNKPSRVIEHNTPGTYEQKRSKLLSGTCICIYICMHRLK